MAARSTTESAVASDASPQVSIVIPCLDEGAIIDRQLQSLQGLRGRGCELILVDGGSSDDSAAAAQPWVDQLVQAPRGRAVQMNAGARVARAPLLWFLHADSSPPDDALGHLCSALARPECCWGRFDVTLSGQRWSLRLVETMMNGRSRLTGIATGDQGIFVTREAFQSVGGFPEIPLMEDVALSQRLRRLAAPVALRQRITTSSRRWERQGVWRTIGRMWWLRLAFALGSDPEQLARRYRQCSSPTSGS